MSKAVLISIRPEWCEKIASRQKTIEVRKTRPKIETPFKCYIYCTKPKKYNSVASLYVDELYRLPSGEIKFGSSIELSCFPDQWDKDNFLNGKVIGEFVCDKIIKAERGEYVKIPANERAMKAYELMDYADEKTVYGWHISDLVLYDKPKELSEFHKSGYRNGYKIVNDNKRGVVSVPFTCENAPLQRPPQSWCYVEKLK